MKLIRVFLAGAIAALTVQAWWRSIARQRRLRRYGDELTRQIFAALPWDPDARLRVGPLTADERLDALAREEGLTRAATVNGVY